MKQTLLEIKRIIDEGDWWEESRGMLAEIEDIINSALDLPKQTDHYDDGLFDGPGGNWSGIQEVTTK